MPSINVIRSLEPSFALRIVWTSSGVRSMPFVFSPSFLIYLIERLDDFAHCNFNVVPVRDYHRFDAEIALAQARGEKQRLPSPPGEQADFEERTHLYETLS